MNIRLVPEEGLCYNNGERIHVLIKGDAVMKKKILSLALALSVYLSLAAPSFAAGTTETVTDEEHGVSITMDGFLRREIHRYRYDGGYHVFTICVVEDGSAVTVKAMDGRRYGPTEADYDRFWEITFEGGDVDYAYSGMSRCYTWDGEYDRFANVPSTPQPLKEPEIHTMSPSDGEVQMCAKYSVYFLCESDFAKLVPFEGRPNADDWARETLENAYDAGLLPYSVDPYADDCTDVMARYQFANMAVNLYEAMGGSMDDAGEFSPFTDVERDYYVGCAYNLGIMNGTGETTFSPGDALTREQAAVVLARIYAKIHGDIPAVTAAGFADDGQISAWARDSVAFMADKGIVKGVGDNQFAPQKLLSIQEAVSMAYRMLEDVEN